MSFPWSWHLSCGDGHCFSLSLRGSISIIVLCMANSGTAVSEQGLVMGLSTEVTVVRTEPRWLGPLPVSPQHDQRRLSQCHILGAPPLLLPCTCHKQQLTVITNCTTHTTFWEAGWCFLWGSRASHKKPSVFVTSPCCCHAKCNKNQTSEIF
jgi:hypothetical protein